MKGKRQQWAYGPRTYSVIYQAETPDEVVAKAGLDVRDAHRLCLSAKELGLDASLIVSQRVFAVTGDGSVDTAGEGHEQLELGEEPEG